VLDLLVNHLKESENVAFFYGFTVDILGPESGIPLTKGARSKIAGFLKIK